MNRWLIKTFHVAMLLGLVLCQPGINLLAAQAAAPDGAMKITPTPTPRPDANLEQMAQSGDLPPLVIATTPPLGQEADPSGAIEIVFDQAMRPADTQAAFSLTAADGAALPGAFSWTDTSHLRFKPARPLALGAVYTVTLLESALSEKGIPLGTPYTFNIATGAPLQISQVFPAPDTQGVEITSRITITFTRPVVPLGILEEQSSLVQPLVLSPAIPGTGEWISTSIYVFEPAQPLKSGTVYTARIAAGLLDSTTSPSTALPETYTWMFTTVPASIAGVEIGDVLVDPLSPYTPTNIAVQPRLLVTFRQAMQTDSTLRAITLRDANGAVVPFNAAWNADNTQVTLSPTRALNLGQSYRFAVSNLAAAQDGGLLASGMDIRFSTVNRPAIKFTVPTNTEKNAQTYFEIHFVSPMNLESVVERVSFSPPLETKNNYWYDSSEYTVNFYGLQPSTQYTVTLQPGMTDLTGNAIAEGRTIQFTTQRIAPYGNLAMPYEPVFRAGSELEFAFQHTNVPAATFWLYRVSLERYFKAHTSYTPTNEMKFEEADLVWQYELQTSAPENQNTIERIPLKNADGTAVPAGLYFLAMGSNYFGAAKFDDGRYVVVSNGNLTIKTDAGQVLLWATDFEDGAPRAGLPLAIYNRDGKKLNSGETDADGLLRLPLNETAPGYAGYIAVSEDNQEYYFVNSDWGSGFSTYDFGIYDDYYAPPSTDKAYIYTERPLYRPGQPVYFKGILRQDDDLRYSLPDAENVVVIIKDMDGKMVYNEMLDLNPYGSFHGEFTLDDDAALGSYTIEANYRSLASILGMVTFTVAEYRRPEFMVDVTTNPQNVLGGRGFSARIQSDYYSGGGVAGAKVDWTVQSDPFVYTPPEKYNGYSFLDRDDEFFWLRGGDEGSSEIIAEGSTVTDKDGRAAVELIADISKFNASRRLTLESTITDLSGFSVSGRADLVAHRSEGYVGIRSSQYVGRAGEEQTFELVALDWFGQPIPGQPVDVTIYERRWNSVQQQDAQGNITWTSSVEEIPVVTLSGLVMDENGEGVASFTPAKGGVYKARATALDRQGNPAVASTILWVAGEEYIPWRQTNDRTFSLVTDKTSYKPGDTAEILIASPFQGSSYALITTERGKLRSSEVVLLESNSTVYPIKITSDMAPLVYVSVLVVKGIDATNPRPNFKVGMATLNVSTEQQEVKVEITPDRESAAPGEEITYTVRTSDTSGKPVAAEVSLGLSDLSTLSLLPANSVPILEYFYSRRALQVRTALAITNNIEEYNAMLKDQAFAVGRGGGSGGGKGEGEFGVPLVRSDFPDTAYWKADVVTNADGVATVRLKLPDNLTIWRMDARAATQDTRLGQATQDLQSTRPLLVRPQTPRFFVAGDRAVLGAAVHNNTGQDLTVTVSMDVQGVIRSGKFSQEVNIPNGQQTYVTWNVAIPEDSERVDLIFSASGGGFNDASRPTISSLENNGLPVYRYEVPETVATSGEVASAGVRTEAIRLPAGMEISQGSLDVKIERSLAAGMTEGLKYLETYPYECTEQVVSKFLPNVLTTRALKTAGIDDPALEANLKTQVNLALQKLYKRQQMSGGWGWWPGDATSDITSAYVVLGLIEARSAGYEVDSKVLENGLRFIKTHATMASQSADKQLAGVAGNRLAFLLYVLARAEEAGTGSYLDVSRVVQLFDSWQSLHLYARGYLAQTLAVIDPSDPRIDTLLSSIVDNAIISATGAHWQEKDRDYWNWNTDTRSTAILLNTLTKIDPANALNSGAVRWLMSNRTSGRWGNTQETAWTLMALTGWMAQSGELKADYSFVTAFNGQTITQGEANQDNLREITQTRVEIGDLLTDATNALTFARDGQAGRMYYTAGLELFLPVDQVKAIDQGLSISRRYVTRDENKTPVTKAQQGDLLLAQITIVAPNDLHYVLIEDPLPAGFEAVDTSLKSSPQAAAPDSYDWERLDEEGWGWWYFSHAELRDEKLVLSTQYLPAGTYVYTYLVRASSPGTFNVIPPTGQEFYFPEVYGRGEGSTFEVSAQ